MVSTNPALARHDTDFNSAGSHRKGMVHALEHSLARFATHTQMSEALGVLDVELSTDRLAAPDDVGRVGLGFSPDFVGSDQVRDVVHGPGQRLID